MRKNRKQRQFDEFKVYLYLLVVVEEQLSCPYMLLSSLQSHCFTTSVFLMTTFRGCFSTQVTLPKTV